MSVFSKNNVNTPKPKRNNYDLSRQNNLTGKFGTLYPCFVQEVVPGDSIKIDIAAGIRMLPYMFPIQTKLKAYVELFYCRNRTLWHDWQDWICSPDSDSHSFPFLSYNNTQKQFKTGSLGDYLGLPTTVIGTNSSVNNVQGNAVAPTSSQNFTAPFTPLSTVITGTPPDLNDVVHLTNSTAPTAYFFISSFSETQFPKDVFVRPGDSFSLVINCSVPPTTLDLAEDVIFNMQVYLSHSRGEYAGGQLSPTVNYRGLINGNYVYNVVFQNISSETIVLGNGNLPFLYIVTKDYEYQNGVATGTDLGLPTRISFVEFIFKNGTPVDASVALDARSIYDKLRVSALPFRAYEQVYNAFYRDQRNNPIKDSSGKLTPNVYCPTSSDVDNYDYCLRQRNWEQDFLTTAVESPQQGIAPLVGITSTGKASFVSEDGNTYSVDMTVGDDGDTIISPKLTSDLPDDVRKSAINVATEGISINDFRGVNALQHWLERNIRRGFKYRDQIAGHYGVTPSYAELDMPEFIGGVSEYLNVNQINQTSESTELQPLGSFSGQGSLVMGNKHSISKYCDEHGYIIGIFSIVPVPCYSQLLPKHFLKKSPLDYYFPEFNHLGMQPIKYNEVAPLQVIYANQHTGDSKLKLDDTFGYQLPWYDYISSVDEVHGQFRTYYRNFLLQRSFGSLPVIEPEFLTVNTADLNNIFAVDSDNDKFLGQLHFKVSAKRGISRVLNPQII